MQAGSTLAACIGLWRLCPSPWGGAWLRRVPGEPLRACEALGQWQGAGSRDRRSLCSKCHWLHLLGGRGLGLVSSQV